MPFHARHRLVKRPPRCRVAYGGISAGVGIEGWLGPPTVLVTIAPRYPPAVVAKVRERGRQVADGNDNRVLLVARNSPELPRPLLPALFATGATADGPRWQRSRSETRPCDCAAVDRCHRHYPFFWWLMATRALKQAHFCATLRTIISIFTWSARFAPGRPNGFGTGLLCHDVSRLTAIKRRERR